MKQNSQRLSSFLKSWAFVSLSVYIIRREFYFSSSCLSATHMMKELNSSPSQATICWSSWLFVGVFSFLYRHPKLWINQTVVHLKRKQISQSWVELQTSELSVCLTLMMLEPKCLAPASPQILVSLLWAGRQWRVLALSRPMGCSLKHAEDISVPLWANIWFVNCSFTSFTTQRS